MQLEPLPLEYTRCKNCNRKFIVKANIGKDLYLRCDRCHREHKEQSGYKENKHFSDHLKWWNS